MKWNLLLSLFPISVIAFAFPYLLFHGATTLDDPVFFTYMILRVITGLFAFYVLLSVILLTITYRNLWLLSFSGTLFVLSYYLETMSFFMLNSSKQSYVELSKTIFMISQYLITLAPLLLMYFVVHYFTRKPSYWAFLPMVADVLLESVYQPMGRNLGIADFEIGQVHHWVYQPKNLWVNVVYYLSIVWIVGYVIYLVLSSTRGTTSTTSKEQQQIFIAGIVVVFIVAPLIHSFYIFISDPLLRFIWITIVGRSLVISGLSIFIITFVRSSRKLDYFQPQPLIRISVYDTNLRKEIYQKRFQDQLELEIISFLHTNLDDLNSLMSEVTGQTTHLQTIETAGYEIMVADISSLTFRVVLVVKYLTGAIQERFDRLLDQLRSSASNLILADLQNLIQLNFGA